MTKRKYLGERAGRLVFASYEENAYEKEDQKQKLKYIADGDALRGHSYTAVGW